MLVLLSDFLEVCKKGTETKQILLNVNGKIIPMGQQYVIIEGIWYCIVEEDEENYIDNDRFIGIVESECINNRDEWGDLYISPMDDIGNCEMRFAKTMSTIKEDEFEIIKIADENSNIVVYLKDKE